MNECKCSTCGQRIGITVHREGEINYNKIKGIERDEALEEAAKIADNVVAREWELPSRVSQALEIANAIRALKGKE